MFPQLRGKERQNHSCILITLLAFVQSTSPTTINTFVCHGCGLPGSPFSTSLTHMTLVVFFVGKFAPLPSLSMKIILFSAPRAYHDCLRPINISHLSCHGETGKIFDWSSQKMHLCDRCCSLTQILPPANGLHGRMLAMKLLLSLR